ncbi:hypothetical protein ABW16_01880 [Mycolicibacter heraklionensis]|uniref:Uncharacterized protein n=1 Tax=Mycolicibacter heraklionensis TaxID=512402 RepID=A0ABR5FKT2_9MYCO|nr:hypothetical protein [Mycolicibacter heraklionensis]KLO31601.1 hypothetical protein ABW16_01880 [Mycolicibacter heraklionensis]
MNADINRARAMLQRVNPGPWWWGGNTAGHGDVALHSRAPGYGVIDIMRTCTDHRTAEEIGAEWDRTGELQDCISRDDYIEHETDHPQKYLAFIETEHMTVQLGRDHATYEVARNQGLPDDTPRDHPKVYRADVVAVRNAHAEFIAASPQLVAGLLAAIDRVAAVVEDLRAHRATTPDDDDHEIICDVESTIADRIMQALTGGDAA